MRYQIASLFTDITGYIFYVEHSNTWDMCVASYSFQVFHILPQKNDVSRRNVRCSQEKRDPDQKLLSVSATLCWCFFLGNFWAPLSPVSHVLERSNRLNFSRSHALFSQLCYYVSQLSSRTRRSAREIFFVYACARTIYSSSSTSCSA